MLNIEDISHLLSATAGKVVGIATYRGEYVIVATEYGLYRVWDNGIEPRVSPAPESDRKEISG